MKIIIELPEKANQPAAIQLQRNDGTVISRERFDVNKTYRLNFPFGSQIFYKAIQFFGLALTLNVEPFVPGDLKFN